jgi:hypothetical protein
MVERSTNCTDGQTSGPTRRTEARNDATDVFVAGSTAVAACEALWGSTPMIMVMLRSMLR